MAASRAYCGPPPTPEGAFAQWNLDPLLIAVLLAAGGWLAWRGRALAAPAAGWVGLGVLALAFVSPLCAVTTALFSVRVIHHLLLVTLAAPMFAIAAPPAQSGAIAPRFVIATGIFWAWHLPAAYDAALADPGIYWLMQVSLLVSATGFWRQVLAPGAQPLASIAAIIAAVAQMGLLGALITFAGRPLYEAHALTTQVWGLEPLADQQLAGLAMWVPGMLPYAMLLGWVARRQWRSGAPAA